MVAPDVPGPIAIVNRSINGTGTVLKSIEIAGALQDAGQPVELWAMGDEGTMRHRVPPGVPVVAIGGAALSGPFAAPYAIARAVKKRRPAVLLSGGKHFHIASRLGLAFSGRRRLTRFGGRASNPAVHPHVSPFWQWTQVMSLRLKYGGMDFTVAVTRELEDELHRLLGEVRCEITTIPNGVDVHGVRARAAKPADHPWIGDNNGPVIVAVGRLAPQKGFDILIAALARLRKTGGRHRLIILGGGHGVYPDGLRTLAVRLGVADAVSFAGFVDDPVPIVARADLFAVASRWEGASNALLEAIATPVPLVATDCPTGNRALLENGALGTLAVPEDPDALAAAILRELAIVRDPGHRAAAALRHDLGRCLDRYVQLLSRQRSLAPVG